MNADKILRRLGAQERAALKADIESAVVLHIQNVSDYFWDGTGDDFAGWDAIPSPIPPWPLIWCEWAAPQFVRIGNERRRYGAPGVRHGHLVRTQELPDGGWVVNFAEFTAHAGFIWGCEVTLAADGSVVRRQMPTAVTNEITARVAPSHYNLLSDTVLLSAKRTLLAFAFANCRNVQIAERPIPKALRASRLDRNRVVIDKVYTLEIQPMVKVLDGEGRRREVGLEKALHICRGHFKNYDDKPLFGRLRGRFWCPSHVRGNAMVGTVSKDYAIQPAVLP